MMYQPRHFEMTREASMRSLISDFPLATLIAGQGDQMQINHVPMMIVGEPGKSLALHCHVARANPVWQLLAEKPGAVAIFTGLQRYISPNWYASKFVNGKVVPTWNYEAVHVYGQAQIRDDKKWLGEFLDLLTNTHEADQHKPWQVSDAPSDYLEVRFKGIVGIEIAIERWEGKSKLSQNQPKNNRESVMAGLRAHASADTSVSEAMAARIDHETGGSSDT